MSPSKIVFEQYNDCKDKRTKIVEEFEIKSNYSTANVRQCTTNNA